MLDPDLPFLQSLLLSGRPPRLLASLASWLSLLVEQVISMLGEGHNRKDTVSSHGSLA